MQLERDDAPFGNWVATLVGEDEREVVGRSLPAVLAELLELPRGKPPQWFADLVDQVLGQDTPVGRRYPCPCCDFLTLPKPPPGTFWICDVCRWHDDGVQFEDPDYRGGANEPSLREARENFRAIGASDPARRERARPPRPEERP